MKRLLLNLDFFMSDTELRDSFEIEGYKFIQKKKYSHTKSKVNGYVTYHGKQKDSIINKGGKIINNLSDNKKRKLIDDLLIIGTLITGSNWAMHCQRNLKPFPVISNPYLENILLYQEAESINTYFEKAIENLFNPTWAEKYKNGYHLKMLVHRANILTNESRFLAHMVIWEWLYTTEKHKEPKDLNKTVLSILKLFFGNEAVNINRENNILPLMRNYYAHYGYIPPNQPVFPKNYTENRSNFIKEAKAENLEAYERFFDKLTQVIVLKTLGINAEHIFSCSLSNFLKSGRL